MRIAMSILLALALAGCAGRQTVNPVGSMIHRSQTVRAKDPPILLDCPGPVVVDVESFNGDVLVRVDETASQASVTLRTVALQGWGRRGEARASLDEISCDAAIVPGDLGMHLQVRTGTTAGEPHFQRANLLIIVPAIDGARVRTGRGDVTLRGVQGALDVEIEEGQIIVATNRPLTEPVRVSATHAGDIFYRVRGESSGEFDARTAHGTVSSRVMFGRYAVLSGTSPSILHARLNDGSNPVRLDTARGEIRLAVIAEPEQYGMYIFD